ncbi:MAG TPA: hypothetical protein VII56_12275 [Rhizomicrobium sp.]
MPDTDTPVHACGECTMCCKVMAVDELAKPAGRWCGHCDIAKGCKIYESRPGECRTFDCVWRFDAALGPEWRPDTAHFVMAYEIGGKRLTLRVDPQRPDAWKQPPYYARLKQMARQAMPRGQYVMVASLGRAIVILPERDIDLGTVGPDERIATRLWGPDPDAFKVHKSDSRLREA